MEELFEEGAPQWEISQIEENSISIIDEQRAWITEQEGLDYSKLEEIKGRMQRAVTLNQAKPRRGLHYLTSVNLDEFEVTEKKR